MVVPLVRAMQNRAKSTGCYLTILATNTVNNDSESPNFVVAPWGPWVFALD